jgi:colanic acid biosynthesis protein WcaH
LAASIEWGHEKETIFFGELMKILRFDHAAGPRPDRVGPYLSKAVYRRMLSVMPVVCVDMVVVCDDQFVLVKRANAPHQGKWFVPGGRMTKNETLHEAVQRKLFEETGVRAAAPQLIAVAEHFNVPGYLANQDTHILSFAFLTRVRRRVPLRVDGQSSDARWFDKLPRGLHSYPRSLLQLAGF